MAKKYLYGPLRGYTIKNPLTADPNDFILRVFSRGKYTLRQIAELVASEGHSNETSGRIEECVQLVLRKAALLSLEGYTIDLDMIRIRQTVSGKFNEPTEPYLQERHQVRPIIIPGAPFMKAAEQTKVINDGVFRGGVIATVINRETGSINSDITPGRTMELRGMGMRVGDNGDLKGALEVVDAETYEVMLSISSDELLNNEPRKIIFFVPQDKLIAGNYYIIRIITYLNNSRNLLKSAKVIEGDQLLYCLAEG